MLLKLKLWNSLNNQWFTFQIVPVPCFQVRFICGGPTQGIEPFFSDITSFSSCEKLEKIYIFQNCSSCNNQVRFPFKTISVVLCVADTLNVYRGLMRNRYPKSTLTEVFWVNTKVSPVRAKWVTIKIKGKLSGRRSLERGGKIASLLPCYGGSKGARSCKS